VPGTVADHPVVVLDTAGLGGLGGPYSWVIPGVFLFPAGMILFVVLAQAAAGMILVPVTRHVLRRNEEPIRVSAGRAGSAG
jgi:hypothetical protein